MRPIVHAPVPMLWTQLSRTCGAGEVPMQVS